MDIKAVKVSKLGKCQCANCGGEIDSQGSISLKDGNDICLACLDKAPSLFNPEYCNFDDYKASFNQQLKSKSLYEQYFLRNKNSKVIVKSSFNCKYEINTSASLFAVTTKVGSFLNRHSESFVFNISDIDSIETCKVAPNEETMCIKMVLKDFVGISQFKMDCDKYVFEKVSRELNKAKGITGVRGIKTAFASTKIHDALAIDQHE